MVTQINILVMSGWLPFLRFHVNGPPRSWDKAFSDSDLETPRSMSLVQYQINSLPIHFTSIRPRIPEIELFRDLTLKHPRSMSWGRSKVKFTYCTQYRTHALHFRFTSIGPTIVEIWPKQCLTLKKHIRTFKRKFAKITVSNRFYLLSNQVITMTRTTKLPCFDPMSGSHFFAQTSNFWLIDATSATLGRGHGIVIQYIAPDPYIRCAKYQRFSSNGDRGDLMN